MRSSALLRRSRLFLRSTKANPLAASSRRTNKTGSPSRPSTRGKRSPSSDFTPPTSPQQAELFAKAHNSALELTSLLLNRSPGGAPSNDPEPPNTEPPSADEPEQPKQRSSRASATKDGETIELPEGLDILWTPELTAPGSDASEPANLPPPEIFDEVLNNLHISLHPQTQHRATYASPLGQPIEPTIALYCPVEGGDSIIDATVRELARRIGAEVLVLDSVQLAAGEWGDFGKAADSLQLPRNPLHFSASPAPANTNSSAVEQEEEDDDDESDSPSMQFGSRQMTLTLIPPNFPSGLLKAASPSRESRRTLPPSKIKVFFDSLVNLAPKEDQTAPRSTKNRPRLVYVRDFPTLAPTSASWYPHLLAAVRQRRKGPLSRPSSPIHSPMTIIFGMTPPLTPTPSHSSGPTAGLMNLLMSRSSSPSAPVVPIPRPGKSDWGEGEIAEKAREKRLRDRLKKWEKGDAALLDEMPKLSLHDDREHNDSHRPEVIILGPNNISGISPRSHRDSESEDGTSFFRSSILVPAIRSPATERECRVARRREINELTMRMAVGAIGGILDKSSADTSLPVPFPEEEKTTEENIRTPTDHERMWDNWGRRVEVWSVVRHIADHAVGSVVANRHDSGEQGKATLEPTHVPWSAVHSRWAAYRSAQERRKAWVKEVLPAIKARTEELDAEQPADKLDELVERLKSDGDLESHEQRLLSCIVDTASMPTSFSQVHLPPHTIDSVRTIVSLPLLHPQAFQKGILKEHGMTGCLLFGPPGTGKTLLVRALAKEAGCRMMVISPADVMDMYVGEGEKLVKAVFTLARRLSPCVVFLDEIDALFGARMSARESGGAFAHRGVITEFMQEMDGLRSSNEDSVIVIGATNRPFDLDDAVLRRLPRRLLVDLPGQKEREEILKILLHDESLSSDIDIEDLGKKTESFSGSDLKHLCVSAALDAVKEHVRLPWMTTSKEEAPPPVEPPLATEAVTSTSSVAEGYLPPVSEQSPPASLEAEKDDSTPTETTKQEVLDVPAVPEAAIRVLSQRHFAKALKEITPSSSEALGSLSALRKWNDEFGEGRKDRKRQVWGKGRFGFNDKAAGVQEDGRVLPTPSQSSGSGSDITGL